MIERLILLALAVTLPLLALEWLLPSHHAHRHSVPPPAVVASAPAASRPPAPKSEATAVSILARPLFTPGRKPTRTTTVVQGAPMASLPRLSGVAITPASKVAIFDTAGTAKVVRPGDVMGEYRISAIDPSHVTVEGPQGEQSIAVAFAGSQTAIVAAQPPSILDRLNSEPPPVYAVPRPPSVRTMMARAGLGRK